MQWKHLPIVAFDTETTGLNPFSGDRIIEFAAVAISIDAEFNITGVTEHSWLINPGIPIPQKITEITGISDVDVVGKPSFREVASEVRQLLSGAITVAHNYPFDLNFLTVELNRCELNWPEPLAEIDTVDLSLKHFPEAKGHRLGDVCRRLDIRLEGAHRATNDAEACGRVFIEVARRHQIEDNLHAMLTWANAIGRPPSSSPFETNEQEQLVFSEGPHQGEPVAHYPVHLAWMTKARVQNEQGWQWRFNESTRHWIHRWLNVRASGRAKPNMKSNRSEDWVIDSCIAENRVRPQ
jgi:DNA polymerase-3 subunit epsilon